MTGTSVLSAGGRNVPDFRSSIGAQYGEFIGNGDNVGKLLEGEYFTVRGYQKGTVHIVFKRPDLVEKLNDIIARHYPVHCRHESD